MEDRGVRDLEELIEKSTNKLSIFIDKNTFSQYSITYGDLVYLISQFLNDEEIAKAFDTRFYNDLPTGTRYSIIELISDSKIKLKLLENDKILANMYSYQIINIIKSLDDADKIQVLNMSDFLKQYGISNYDKQEIIKSLSNKNKQEILCDKSLIKDVLQLENYQVTAIIEGLEGEDGKKKLIDIWEFKPYEIAGIAKSFSDKTKFEIILNNKYNFNKGTIVEIMATLSADGLIEFFKKNRSFLSENNIAPYFITTRMDNEGQMDFISKFEDIGLSLDERRQILVSLNDEVKESINTDELPKEYKTAIEMKTKPYLASRIIVDLDDDLEKYRGLDDLISMNPLELSEEDRRKLLKLCEICPEISILDDLQIGASTSREYIESEIWIESVLQKLDPEWTNIQKVAFIDNVIGKKISYSPDFDTEVFDHGDSRALWKIISSGYGICNGIAQVEKYILARAGINSRLISSENHSFLKLIDIELPTENGESVKCDTILDPTWNLAAHKYGGMPNNFCLSYEDIRKHDIEDDGNDRKCHKNDDELSDVTHGLDEKSLRAIYSSIGIANKDGQFPIKKFFNESLEIDAKLLPGDAEVEQLLSLFAEYRSDFAICQSSATKVLKTMMMGQENLNFNRCVINRVYEKIDRDKRPVLYVYVDLPDCGKKFFYADKNQSTFIELSQKEFESKFECYEFDLENHNGNRPWDEIEVSDRAEDLRSSSGKIIAGDKNER